MALTDEQRHKYNLLSLQAFEVLKMAWILGKDIRSMAVNKELYEYVTKGKINGTNG